MSRRLDHLLDIIREVQRRERRGSKLKSLHVVRREAVEIVAEKYYVTKETIRDSYIRQLRPVINSTAQFDEALKDFVRGRPNALVFGLVASAVEQADIDGVVALLDGPEREVS